MKALPTGFVNQSQMADMLDISVNQLITYLKQAKVKSEKIGNQRAFNVKDTIRDYVSIQVRFALKGKSTDEEKSAYERKTEAEANLMELKYDQAAGKVVPIDEMNSVLDRILTTVRQAILAIPGLWTPQLLGKIKEDELAGLLQRLTDDLLLTSLDKAITELDEEPLEDEIEQEPEESASQDD